MIGRPDYLKEMNEMKCIECGGKLVPTTISYTLKSIPPIEIHYLEGYRCTQCNEQFLTRSSLRKIEAIDAKLHEISEVNWEKLKA